MAGFLTHALQTELLSFDINGLQTLGSFFDVKIDSLAFSQGLETVTVDCGEMDEDILTTVSGRNETKTLGLVKPFDCTCSHVAPLQITGYS